MKALITGVSGQQHAAGGGIAEDGGVVSAERLESVGYGVLKSEKRGSNGTQT